MKRAWVGVGALLFLAGCTGSESAQAARAARDACRLHTSGFLAFMDPSTRMAGLERLEEARARAIDAAEKNPDWKPLASELAYLVIEGRDIAAGHPGDGFLAHSIVVSDHCGRFGPD